MRILFPTNRCSIRLLVCDAFPFLGQRHDIADVPKCTGQRRHGDVLYRPATLDSAKYARSQNQALVQFDLGYWSVLGFRCHTIPVSIVENHALQIRLISVFVGILLSLLSNSRAIL